VRPSHRRTRPPLSSILNLPPIHSGQSIATLHSQPKGANMSADLQFKVAVIGLSALSTILAPLVLFAH
jgi:hypothetical protein